MRQTGGALGMVNPSNLRFALESVHDVGERQLERAAAIRKPGYLLYHLVTLHPFLDGNKRTGFEVTTNFLRLNGWLLAPSATDAFRTLMAIARGERNAQEVERWVGKNLSRTRMQ